MPIRYRLHLSTSLDRFLDDHPDLFYPGGIFGEPLNLVVQNQNVAEWLKVRLAEKQGIAVDRGILLPELALRRFVGRFEGAVPEGRRVLYMDSLKIAVYRELADLLEGDDPDFEPLRQYRQCDPDSRMYDLSDTAAGLFYNYSMNCFSVLAAWNSPDSAVLFPEAGEAWQKKLWTRLFGPGSPWLLAGQVMERIIRDRLPWSGGEERIVLFGSSFLGEAALRFFHHLSRYVPVDHCLFSPGSDPLWGNPGRDVEQLLGSLDGVVIERGWKNPSAPGGSLSLIQERLFSGTEGEPLTADDTFRVLACPGDLRQVETARDIILGALRDDPGLKLTDIGLMAPDINRFSPLIGSMIRPLLPCNFIDLSGPDGTPLAELPEILFGLAGSRFSRADIFPLMTNPCFRARHPFDESDFMVWTDALDKLAVCEGFDDKPWSWESAFGRQAEYLLGGDEDVPLPVFDEQRGLTLIRITALVRKLGEDLSVLAGLKLSLADWVSRTLRFWDAWTALRPDNREDEADYRIIQRAFRNIQNAAMEVARPEGSPLLYPFGFWRRLFLETVGKARGSRGRYLTGGITCSSLKPLRAVPFRMIVVLGLDEEVFPVRRAPESFDLSVKYGTVIDFTREAGDLYGFLETVTACGGALHLFFNGSDPRRNTPMFPSEVIARLLGFFGKREPVRIPLQPYDPALFGPEAAVESLSVSHYREALRFVAQPSFAEGETPAVPVPLPEEAAGSLTVRDLERFLRDPVEEFFYRRFGVRLGDKNDEDLFMGTGQEPMVGNLKKIPLLVQDWTLTAGFDAAYIETTLSRMEREGTLQSGYRDLLRDDLAEVTRTAQEKLANREPWGEPVSRVIEESDGWPLSGRIGPLYRDGSGRPVLISFVGADDPYTSQKIALWLQGILFRLTGAIDPGESFALLFLCQFGKRNYDRKGGPVALKTVEKIIPPGTGDKADRALLDSLVALYRRGMTEPLPLLPAVMEKLKGPDYLSEAASLMSEGLEDDSDHAPFARTPAVLLYRDWISGFDGLDKEMALLASIHGGLVKDVKSGKK